MAPSRASMLERRHASFLMYMGPWGRVFSYCWSNPTSTFMVVVHHRSSRPISLWYPHDSFDSRERIGDLVLLNQWTCKYRTCKSRVLRLQHRLPWGVIQYVSGSLFLAYRLFDVLGSLYSVSKTGFLVLICIRTAPAPEQDCGWDVPSVGCKSDCICEHGAVFIGRNGGVMRIGSIRIITITGNTTTHTNQVSIIG